MSLRCETCGAAYTLVGDADEGYFRSLCECEATHSCGQCKRGSKKPINQARLDLQLDVNEYLCKAHGYYEAEEFPELEPKQATKGKRTATYVAEPKAPEPVEDPTKHPRSGMDVVEHAFFKTSEVKWSELKKITKDALKSPDAKYKVVCTACNHEHLYSTRKLAIDDETKTIRIVCPKCDGPSYRIL